MRFSHSTFLLLALLVFCTPVSHAVEYRLLRVYDGDTVKIQGPYGKFKLRLTGIDAPERNQAYGKKARRAVHKLCKKNAAKIHVQLFGLDKYKRHLGRLYCNGIDISLLLTKQGLAWHNRRYSNDINLFVAQIQAQKNRKGLWQQNNPTPPWVWRKKYQHR